MAVAVAGSPQDMEKLQKKLHKRVTQAVDAVCGEWAREQTQTLQADTSLDRSYGSCRKLVAYIAENMATSPGFVEQMDRIILACFSGASRRVLNNVATQEVWFQSQEVPDERETPRPRRPGKAVSDKPIIKQERVEVTATTVADGAMGLRTREVAGSLLSKRPRSRTSKKKMSTNRSLQALVVADPKPKAATRRVDVSSAEESVEARVETDTDEEQKKRKRPKKRLTPLEKPRDALPIEDAHGLLTFKEAIGELCYQERRTPEQTEFFKERLRKSIQFVDALLCHPPPGKTCTRTCRKIRVSMCKNTTPCEDKMCRIWHDVEAHTDRCKNPKCEFKLRILVRETMHKIHSKQLEIKNSSTKLRRKNSMLDEFNTTELSEPGTFTDSIVALEGEIANLEQSLVDEGAEMATINGTLEKYWTTLNEIGVESRHDEIDNFPEFVTHYSSKKKRK
ncbi:hypothetical protein KRP22_010713 [Phytophthora ramorum]|uniref:uncharacterized protein n=1 Tax=Phytophthora ramorum TaxID=164328 RepID=UPI0030A3C172|nr:hypothetical protein KRP23_6037 [Phytophthora ramorum]KAH7504933.1 hypothetical protein KRP22_5415 [Phytophthora ramorum]